MLNSTNFFRTIVNFSPLSSFLVHRNSLLRAGFVSSQLFSKSYSSEQNDLIPRKSPAPSVSGKSIHEEDPWKSEEEEGQSENQAAGINQIPLAQDFYVLKRDEILAERKKKREEAKFGDYPNNLVKRPAKGFLWGLGTETYDKSKSFFRDGKLPTIKEVIHFLEVFHMKDITVTDLREGVSSGVVSNFAICCSGYSSRHIYKVARSLAKEVKELNCQEIINPPKVLGRSDDPWLLVTVKEIGVNFFVEEEREEIALEFKWHNPTTKEMMDDFYDYELSRVVKGKTRRRREVKRRLIQETDDEDAFISEEES